MTAWGFRKGTGMDLKGLPQTVQNFIEETIQNRENGKFPDNETCQKVMDMQQIPAHRSWPAWGFIILQNIIGRTTSMKTPCNV